MHEEHTILIASEANISIRTVKDIPEVIGACTEVDGLLLTHEELAAEFFNLKSGLAGELLQKLVSYRIRTAIVVPSPEAYGERFSELAYEHRSHSLIRFVASKSEAEVWLSGQV